MNKDILKKFFAIMTYVVLYLIFSMISMLIIRQVLDSQVPNLDFLIESGKNQSFDLKLFGIVIQSVMFSIHPDGSFIIDYNNTILFYIIPFIFALILTFISIFIIKRVKKFTSKLKL
ncbi:MAG: hypothetical protein ACLSIC_15700 [Blautia wexlerae]